MGKKTPNNTANGIDLNTCNPAADWSVICNSSNALIAELSKDNPSASNVLYLTNLMSKTKGYQRLGHKGGLDYFNTHLSNHPWNKPLFSACHKISEISAILGMTATSAKFSSFRELTRVSSKHLHNVLNLARKKDNCPMPSVAAILEVIDSNPGFLKKKKSI